MDIIEKNDEDEKKSTNKLAQINPLVFAFLGDSVHTLYVRENVIKESINKLNDYNKKCNFLCRAKTQSKVLDNIYDKLMETEKDLIRRTRNTKLHHTSKNSNLIDYKKATCFEALVGYLYLKGEKERLNQILKMSIEIEGKNDCRR